MSPRGSGGIDFQSLSLLCSDRGRAVWCAEPIGVKIARGEIALESDRGAIVLKEDAGRSLAEAFRYASKTWFPPTGEEPELMYFAAPQYNTWIELTYHQNEKDILAYAKSMLDHGLPPGDDGNAVEGPTAIEVATPIDRLPHFVKLDRQSNSQ